MAEFFAKAISKDETSDAIVVSFGRQWLKKIKEKEVSLVLRRRAPVKIEPRLMYMHFNYPYGAICARAKIDSLEKISLNTALENAEQLSLTKEEISQYFGALDDIYCYKVSDIVFSERPITSSDFNLRLKYHPPQSFIVLSIKATMILNEMWAGVDAKADL
jgi:predicted transcriptional regulator